MSLRSIIRFLSLPGLGLRIVANRRIGRIRAAMLSLLVARDGPEVRRIEQRVRFAENLETLWYLRQDLVAVLSATGEEATVREQIVGITALFRGWLPATMVPRVHHRFTV